MDQHRWGRFVVPVIGLHVLGLLLLVRTVHGHPTLLGMAVLAYVFGLRHAFDVDHIAAIDNTVRKLAQERQNPMGVGFFFSLGHSTVVTIFTLLIGISVTLVKQRLPGFESIGSIVGPAVSGVFLLLIGLMNILVLGQVLRLFVQMRTDRTVHTQLDYILSKRGWFARLINPLLRLVTKSWHVYPIGFLFGLGFDTATEVAVLGMSAVAAKNGLPLAGLFALPVAFSAGMSLMDTADGVFMTTAYQWAFSTPLRKVYYNLSITSLGVIAAILVGLTELVQVVVPLLGLKGAVWQFLLHISFSKLGYVLAALFVSIWAVSFGVWKLFHIEERWASASSRS